MNSVKKAFKIMLMVIVILFVCDLVYSLFVFRERGKFLDSFEEYAPTSCPNTLWTCTEAEIYFASDENGRTLGAVRRKGEIIYFGIGFSRQYENFDVWKLEDISFPHYDARIGCFDGEPTYMEDSCTLIAEPAYYEKNNYFGQKNGNVTLTFVKSDLTAPFSFDNEDSLNELPFR